MKTIISHHSDGTANGYEMPDDLFDFITGITKFSRRFGRGIGVDAVIKMLPDRYQHTIRVIEDWKYTEEEKQRQRARDKVAHESLHALLSPSQKAALAAAHKRVRAKRRMSSH